jgi:DNA-binding transcriptional ArsR family regulator
MPDVVPPHVRAIAFAACELMLDQIYALQSYTKADLESMLILLYVTDATMRPFMLDPGITQEVLTAAQPPDEIRGSISRRMIAEKTGLPRETVRRKTQELAEAGLLIIDDEDRIRSAKRLAEPEFRRIVEDGHRAVLRYVQRLEALGISMDCLSR